jgi:predicted PurR-regulated permease PerM
MIIRILASHLFKYGYNFLPSFFTTFLIYFSSFHFLLHFQTLAPEWKSAAELFDPAKDDVILAAVDATLSPALTARFVS